MKKQASRRTFSTNRKIAVVEKAIVITGIFWGAIALFNVYLIIHAEAQTQERIELCYAHYEAQGWDAYEAAAECEEL